MADSDYRRLGCAMEACAGVHKARGYCVRHYRQWQRGGLKRLDVTGCIHCGENFQPARAGAMYCSKRCKLGAWVAANPGRWQELNQRLTKKRQPPLAVSRVYFNTCRVCGTEWTGQTRRHYCSEACVKVDACRKSDQRSRELHKRAGKVVQCCECAASFCPLYGAKHGAIPLCAPCAAIRKRRNEAAYGGSNIQRAKRAGVPYRYFNERRVLERDGWTCQLCGVPTPKDARGTFQPNAPEFDHCIPLAMGGPHVPENGQCLCRACNLAKADSWCETSAAAAMARGVEVPAGANRRRQAGAISHPPQTTGRGQIARSAAA